MKLEDLLRMAFNDGKRYGQGNTNLNFKQHFESTEYIEAIKLVKNCSIPDVSVSFLYDFVNEFTDTEIPKEAIKETLDKLNEC